MTASFTPAVYFHKPTRGQLPPPLATCHNARIMTDQDATFAAIGERLRALRLAFGPTKQVDWCAKHNFTPSQWNNWERGTKRISVDSAERLCEIYGLTLDWIYRGRRDGLAETASKVL